MYVLIVKVIFFPEPSAPDLHFTGASQRESKNIKNSSGYDERRRALGPMGSRDRTAAPGGEGGPRNAIQKTGFIDPKIEEKNIQARKLNTKNPYKTHVLSIGVWKLIFPKSHRGAAPLRRWPIPSTLHGKASSARVWGGEALPRIHRGCGAGGRSPAHHPGGASGRDLEVHVFQYDSKPAWVRVGVQIRTPAALVWTT